MSSMNDNATVKQAVDLVSAWRGAKQELVERYRGSDYESDIDMLELNRIGNRVIELALPSTFVCTRIENHCRDNISAICCQHLKEWRAVEFVVASNPATRSLAAPGDTTRRWAGSSPACSSTSRSTGPDHAVPQTGNKLVTHMSFDQFITDTGNEVARQSCHEMATNPDDQPSSLYIWGPVGMGKSHLLNAAGLEFAARHPHRRTVYIPSERFVQAFVSAVNSRGGGALERFKDQLRRADLLLFDDIHFLASKTRSQEEFLSTFNELCDNGGRIIVAGNAAPNELPATIPQELISRLNGGGGARITKPSTELCHSILCKLCAKHGVMISEDAIDMVVSNVQANIRDLTGAFNRLRAEYSHRDGGSITLARGARCAGRSATEGRCRCQRRTGYHHCRRYIVDPPHRDHLATARQNHRAGPPLRHVYAETANPVFPTRNRSQAGRTRSFVGLVRAAAHGRAHRTRPHH